jgi:hypothetical protein
MSQAPCYGDALGGTMKIKGNGGDRQEQVARLRGVA